MSGAVLQDAFGLTGTVLEGQYRIDRVVGEGGFGVVYRGHHISLDQPVAIKVLKGLDGGDPQINALILEKFRAEARLLYTLSQSSLNIVRSLHFSAVTTPAGVWAPFMVLEWLDGRSLDEDLTMRTAQGLGGRSLSEALPILAGVAEGLATAHRQQVVHRDVKPANVFLVNPVPGEPPRVKVLDFGIAKIMKDGEQAATKGTFAAFTWLYAAPEQLDPRVGQMGLATDVYAFGLLITEILTGRSPMEDTDVVGIMRKAMDPVRRPSPREFGANVTDEVEAICKKAVAVNPADRYPSIVEMWVALSAASRTRSATTMQRPIAMSPGVNPLAATNVAGMSPPSSPHSVGVNPHGATSVGTPPSMAAVSAPPPIVAMPHVPHGQAPMARPSLPSAAQWTPPPPTPPGYGYQPPQPQRWGPAPQPGGPMMMHPQWVRRLPIRPPETMSTTAVVTIVAFTVLLVFSGGCAMCMACLSAAG